MKKALLVGGVVIALWLVWKPTPETLGPGIKVIHQPEQQVAENRASFQMGGYSITPVSRFVIDAKVLAKKHYRTGREADLSPYDLALGWGPMSDESVLAAISISQSGRWYRWSTTNFPIPRRDIETNSANMHMIPANETIKKDLDAIREGQLVQLSGFLVNVDASDGWRWRTSTTRNDTGNGACEIVYVEQVSFL